MFWKWKKREREKEKKTESLGRDYDEMALSALLLHCRTTYNDTRDYPTIIFLIPAW